MRILLKDISDPSITGIWYSELAIDVGRLTAGGIVNLFEDTTASDTADVLYNMTPPPEFIDRVMIWGRLDDNGDLKLFLSPTTGDESFPFAALRGFTAALQGTSYTGTGECYRPNRIGQAVSWEAQP